MHSLVDCESNGETKYCLVWHQGRRTEESNRAAILCRTIETCTMIDMLWCGSNFFLLTTSSRLKKNMKCSTDSVMPWINWVVEQNAISANLCWTKIALQLSELLELSAAMTANNYLSTRLTQIKRPDTHTRDCEWNKKIFEQWRVNCIAAC